MGVASEYATGAELELEWQLIVDPEPKFRLPASIQATQAKEIIVKLDRRSNEEENEPAIEDSLYKEIPMQASIVTRSLPEVGQSSFGGQSIQCIAPTPSPMANNVSWRTANKEVLAALVAQKAAERLENCDLPTPLSKSILKAPLESYDLVVETQQNISDKLDRNPLMSILQVGEPSQLDSLGVPTSSIAFGRSETMISPSYQLARISQPLTIPTTCHVSSARRCGCHSFRYVSRLCMLNDYVLSLDIPLLSR